MNSTEVTFGIYTTTSFGILSDASVPPVLVFGQQILQKAGNAEVFWPAVACL
jgi:hypothetical protein